MRDDFKDYHFVSYMKVVDPLGFRAPHGVIRWFSSYKLCYIYFLNMLREEFCRGYIDPVLLLVDQCVMSHAKAAAIVRRWKWRYKLTDPIIADYYEGGEERDNTLRMLATGLHELTESQFDPKSFEEALSYWKETFNITDKNDNS